MNKVSVIIPTFNQIKYLPTCIDHVLFQTYPNMEIIIVDGGSNDGTKQYLDNLEEQIKTKTFSPVSHMSPTGEIVRKTELVYPQNRTIQIVTFDNDIGATKTYNEGFSRATGKFCTYIVGDDIPYPDMIQESVKAIESNNVDFVYSDMNLVDDNGRILRQMRFPDYDFEKCFADWYHLGVSRLYKTDWHFRVGLMDETYECANDYDHYLRFAIEGASFLHIPKILYAVRYHGDNRKTGQHSPERYKRLMEESKQCAIRARFFLQSRI